MVPISFAIRQASISLSLTTARIAKITSRTHIYQFEIYLGLQTKFSVIVIDTNDAYSETKHHEWLMGKNHRLNVNRPEFCFLFRASVRNDVMTDKNTIIQRVFQMAE